MNKSNSIYQQRINKVFQYVHEHLDEAISLNQLAKVACFSPYHFHRVFVALTGESVNFFTNRLRLEKASRLLKFSHISLANISIECGYSSPSTFSRSFKTYFGISPSSFRDGAAIENSKICKELFPMDQYLVPMTGEEMVKAFPVKIIDFPKRKIAFIRVQNSFEEGVTLAAFEKLVEWAKQRNIFKRETIFGMSLDDPLITPKEKYRYEVCITVPEDFELKPNSEFELMIMDKCKYATTSVSGDFFLAATATHFMFNHWLINSEYEPEHQHGMEIFLDNENVCNWEHFDLQMCIPIKPLLKV